MAQPFVGGFIINSFLHEAVVVFSGLFHVSFDIIFGLIAMQVEAKQNFLLFEFDELEELLLNCPHKRSQVEQKLGKLIRSHKIFNSFAEDVGNYNLTPCYSAVLTNMFSICSGLITIDLISMKHFLFHFEQLQT